MKYLFYCYVLLITYYSYADMPGNKPRPDYKVKISGLVQYADYSFYYQNSYDSIAQLRDSSLLLVQGGLGTPQCISVWAKKNKTNLYTDTLNFCSGESDIDIAIRINMNAKHLSFTTDSTTLNNEKDSISISSATNIQDTESAKNRNIMYFISGLSFLVLVSLVFFVWKKNKKTKS